MPATNWITPYSAPASSSRAVSSRGPMNTTIASLAARLTSRKFLLAVVAGLSAYERGETTVAVAIAALYVLVEGAHDVVVAKHAVEQG